MCIETVFQGLKIENWEVVPGNHPAFHPLRNGKIIIRGEEVGIFGEIHPEVINNYRIPGKVNLFEIDFENLFPNVPSDIKICLLYTSDAADDLTRVDLGGRRI